MNYLVYYVEWDSDNIVLTGDKWQVDKIIAINGRMYEWTNEWMTIADRTDRTTRKVLLLFFGNIAHNLSSRDKFYRTSTGIFIWKKYDDHACYWLVRNVILCHLFLSFFGNFNADLPPREEFCGTTPATEYAVTSHSLWIFLLIHLLERNIIEEVLIILL